MTDTAPTEVPVDWNLVRESTRNPVEVGASAAIHGIYILQTADPGDEDAHDLIDAALEGDNEVRTPFEQSRWKVRHHAVALKNPTVWYQQLPEPLRLMFVLNAIKQARDYAQRRRG